MGQNLNPRVDHQAKELTRGPLNTWSRAATRDQGATTEETCTM